MPKEIILDVTTGIVVLGSVFGVSHWRKLKKKIRTLTGIIEQPRKVPQRATSPSYTEQDDVLSGLPLVEGESEEQSKAKLKVG
jgi:hypothetical protein